MATKIIAAANMNSAAARATIGARVRNPMAMALFFVISCISYKRTRQTTAANDAQYWMPAVRYLLFTNRITRAFKILYRQLQKRLAGPVCCFYCISHIRAILDRGLVLLRAIPPDRFERPSLRA